MQLLVVDSMSTKIVPLTNYFLREPFDPDENEQEGNFLWIMTVGNDRSHHYYVILYHQTANFFL
jgi:hypothetical protein